MYPFLLSLALPEGRHLPQPGLAGGTVHELRSGETEAAHMAFAVLLLAGLPGSMPILWVSFAACAYPPGLAQLGLDPGRCLFAQARNDAQALSALETGLRGGMAGVAETGALSRLAAKRLALAARQGNGIGFLLRRAPAFTALDSTAFATRWLITPAPAGRIRAELLYAKAGRPGVFFYEIGKEAENDTPPALTLVAGAAAGARLRRTG